MLFSTYGHAVLPLFPHPHSAQAPWQGIQAHRVMSQVLGQMPPEWRRTVTFDNGTEFALHYWLHELGIETFFCDTHSPWQKGGVENAIGRLRRFGDVAAGAVYADGPYPAQVPGLQDSGRDLFGKRVALETALTGG